MIAWFESLPIVGTGIIVIGGFLLLSLAVGYVVLKLTPREAREQHNDLAGFILAVIGVVYAVLLAFVAIGVWERFVQAERETYDEATSLTVVYRDAGSFAQGRALRAKLHEYVVQVIDDEWPKMRKGERSVSARELVESVDRDVRDLPANTPRLQNIQGQMLSSMEEALSDRDYRVDMQATGINGIMWFVLAAGALVTVAFTYLFGFKQTLMQQLMIGSLSLLVGLILFLTVALDFPFRGDLRVGPDAFENALRVFSYIKR